MVPSDNLDALADKENKMLLGNNTFNVNVQVNFPDLSQMQRGTGKNKLTVGNFLHGGLF